MRLNRQRVPGLPEFLQGLFEFVFIERLAMPAVCPFQKRHALAFLGARDNRHGSCLAGRVECLEDRSRIVSVDHPDLPAETLEPPGKYSGVVTVRRVARLPERIDIDDGDQLVQCVQRGELGGLPDRSLRAFPVAEQTVDACIQTVEAIGQRHAIGHRQTLSQRAGGNLHPGIVRRGMPLQGAVDLPQRQRVLIDGARLGQCGPQNGRGMALGQHEAVDIICSGITRIPAHFVEEQRRHDLRTRHAGGRMSGTGCRGHAQHQAAQPFRRLRQRRNRASIAVLAAVGFERVLQCIVGIDEFLDAFIEQLFRQLPRKSIPIDCNCSITSRASSIPSSSSGRTLP